MNSILSNIDTAIFKQEDKDKIKVLGNLLYEMCTLKVIHALSNRNMMIKKS